MHRKILYIALITASSPLLSQNVLHLMEGQKMPQANIEQISWIAGEWTASVWEGQAREIWMMPDGGSMTGAFRFEYNDSVQFLELISVAPEKGSLVMKVRHFSADMIAWEEKEESQVFHLVYLEPNRAYFDGITYILRQPTELDVYVEIHNNDGTTREEKFAFRKVE